MSCLPSADPGMCRPFAGNISKIAHPPSIGNCSCFCSFTLLDARPLVTGALLCLPGQPYRLSASRITSFLDQPRHSFPFHPWADQDPADLSDVLSIDWPALHHSHRVSLSSFFVVHPTRPSPGSIIRPRAWDVTVTAVHGNQQPLYPPLSGRRGAIGCWISWRDWGIER